MSTKKTHIQKAKETKENRKTKKAKEEKEKENVVVVNNTCGNLARSDDIVWEFALYTTNLRDVCIYFAIKERGLWSANCDQPTKREDILKSNKLWKTFAYIYLIHVQDENEYVLKCSKNVLIYIFYSPYISNF